MIYQKDNESICGGYFAQLSHKVSNAFPNLPGRSLRNCSLEGLIPDLSQIPNLSFL